MSEQDKRAPEGKLWVCMACGKTSIDKYGGRGSMHGWDVSCAMNCVLFKKELIIYGSDGRVTQITEENK